jgi:hypothetical protein
MIWPVTNSVVHVCKIQYNHLALGWTAEGSWLNSEYKQHFFYSTRYAACFWDPFNLLLLGYLGPFLLGGSFFLSSVNGSFVLFCGHSLPKNVFCLWTLCMLQQQKLASFIHYFCKACGEQEDSCLKNMKFVRNMRKQIIKILHFAARPTKI